MTEGAKKPKRTHWENLVTIFRHHGVTLVFDVGGHKGEYAGYLRRAGYDGRIVSFEPQSAAHAALSEQAADDPNWTVAPRTALGDRDGTITLNLSAETDMSSALPLADAAMAFTPSSRMVASEEAPVCRLASVFEDHARPDDVVFVKVDTQGFERPVVEGADPVMDRIAGWQLEMSIVEIYEGEPDWRAMVDAMAARGYQPHLFIPGYFSRHIARQLQIDGVFFRETPAGGRP